MAPQKSAAFFNALEKRLKKTVFHPLYKMGPLHAAIRNRLVWA